MLTLQEILSRPSWQHSTTPYDVADCQFSSIVEAYGSFVYKGCLGCHSQKRTYDGDFCRKCDKLTANEHFFKVKVEVDDKSGVKIQAQVAQGVFELMASAQEFAELLKPKQLSVLRVFFEADRKYTIKLSRLDHDTKGLTYIITAMQPQSPHSQSQTHGNIDPSVQRAQPEVITISSDSEHEQDITEIVAPTGSVAASTVTTMSTPKKAASPFKVDFNLSEDDEPIPKPVKQTPRRRKRVISDSSDEETPLDESTVSSGPSPKKITQLPSALDIQNLPSTSGTLGGCAGRTRSTSQLFPGQVTPSVSKEPPDDNGEDQQMEKAKVFVPGYVTLAKRGSRYLPATIQKYSSAKVGERLVRFFGLTKNETRPEYRLLRPSVWLTPGRIVQVSRARGDAPASSRTREGRITRVIGGKYVAKRYEVETEDSNGKKKISEFEFHLLSITDEEYSKECFDFLIQDDYLGSENMVVNEPEDGDMDPPSISSSSASSRSSSRVSRDGSGSPDKRRKRTLAQLVSDSTDEEAEPDSFINDGPDLVRAKTPARSPSRDNDFSYTKLHRRKGEIVYVKWLYRNPKKEDGEEYYVYSAATIVKKVADETYVVQWIMPWKETPTIEERNILRVADLVKVGQDAIYMPGWNTEYIDEGKIYEVKGKGNKMTVHMDVPKKNGHVAKKLFDIPLEELSFFEEYVKQPTTSRKT